MFKPVSTLRLALVLLAWLCSASVVQAKCGALASCKVAGGSYHIAFPPGHDASKPYPAVVALHSWGGTGAGLLSSGRMVKKLLAKGYVVVAPEGLRRREGAGNSWEISPATARRNDPAFILAVTEDAVKRFNLKRSSLLLAGFSVGGSMVHMTACAAPGAFKGYAPVSGNFWIPYPARCGGGVNMLHSHGRSDTTMPLAGRRIGSGLKQGNLNVSLNMWAKANGCAAADIKTSGGGIARQNWSGCNRGSVALDFYPGGHSVPKAWADRVIAWFETK